MKISYSVLATNDAALIQALENVGPISVGVSVGNGFEAYSSGVMDPRVCCGVGTNHAVLVVGYGTDSATGLEYWLVKNRCG